MVDELEEIYQKLKEIKPYKKNFQLVMKWWYRFFYVVLEEQGFNAKAINDLFIWGNGGHNWKRLHSTEEEDKLKYKELYEDFLGEIHYVYDRMSLDRLFRTHWIFNELQNRIIYKK